MVQADMPHMTTQIGADIIVLSCEITKAKIQTLFVRHLIIIALPAVTMVMQTRPSFTL